MSFPLRSIEAAVAVVEWNTSFSPGYLYTVSSELDADGQAALCFVHGLTWSQHTAADCSAEFIEARLVVHRLLSNLAGHLRALAEHEHDMAKSGKKPDDALSTVEDDMLVKSESRTYGDVLEVLRRKLLDQFPLYVAAATRLSAYHSSRAPPTAAAEGTTAMDTPSQTAPDLPRVEHVPELVKSEFPDVRSHGTKHPRPTSPSTHKDDEQQHKKQRTEPVKHFLTSLELARYEDVEKKLREFCQTQEQIIAVLHIITGDVSKLRKQVAQHTRIIVGLWAVALDRSDDVAALIPEMTALCSKVAATSIAPKKEDAPAIKAYADRLLSHYRMAQKPKD